MGATLAVAAFAAVAGAAASSALAPKAKVPKLDAAPTTDEVQATMPDKTKRRLQIAKQANSTILTQPGTALGNDASQQRSTLLGG